MSAVPVESAEPRKLNRIREVRCEELVSLRTVARRLQTCVSEVRRAESPTRDVPVSELYRWAECLEVPASLLLEPGAVSNRERSPFEDRAGLILLMKSVRYLQEQLSGEREQLQLIAQNIANQVTQLLPEASGTAPWPDRGEKRPLADFGRAASFETRVPTNLQSWVASHTRNCPAPAGEGANV